MWFTTRMVLCVSDLGIATPGVRAWSVGGCPAKREGGGIRLCFVVLWMNVPPLSGVRRCILAVRPLPALMSWNSRGG